MTDPAPLYVLLGIAFLLALLVLVLTQRRNGGGPPG
jgi:LPXTG-motif cell wall-anchored protein